MHYKITLAPKDLSRAPHGVETIETYTYIANGEKNPAGRAWLWVKPQKDFNSDKYNWSRTRIVNDWSDAKGYNSTQTEELKSIVSSVPVACRIVSIEAITKEKAACKVVFTGSFQLNAKMFINAWQRTTSGDVFFSENTLFVGVSNDLRQYYCHSINGELAYFGKDQIEQYKGHREIGRFVAYNGVSNVQLYKGISWLKSQVQGRGIGEIAPHNIELATAWLCEATEMDFKLAAPYIYNSGTVSYVWQCHHKEKNPALNCTVEVEWLDRSAVNSSSYFNYKVFFKP